MRERVREREGERERREAILLANFKKAKVKFHKPLPYIEITSDCKEETCSCIMTVERQQHVCVRSENITQKFLSTPGKIWRTN